MLDPTYVLEELASDLVRIELPKYKGFAEPIGHATNVYLIRGKAPALIGAGHPTQFKILSNALRELGVSASQIERVIYTSWDVDVLAGATNFVEVDHFVFSPDMVTPFDYESQVEAIRQEIFELADDIIAALPEAGFEREGLEHNLQTYYPAMPRRLNFIPLREGLKVQAGSLTLDVLASPGPFAGHCCLYEAERKWLFSGDFAFQGMPENLEEAQTYLLSLERLAGLDVNLAFPTRGKHDTRGRWALSRGFRFFNNFLSSVPSALVRAPTILEFIEQDLGYRPENLLELVYTYRRYLLLFDELVRLRVITCEGSGLNRQYGTNVSDPREGLRRWS